MMSMNPSMLSSSGDAAPDIPAKFIAAPELASFVTQSETNSTAGAGLAGSPAAGSASASLASSAGTGAASTSVGLGAAGGNSTSSASGMFPSDHCAQSLELI